jgi:tetratricopeptide (TPR) repeat protein
MIRHLLATGLVLLSGWSLGCSRTAEVGKWRAGAEPARAFVALPPGCELMVIAPEIELRGNSLEKSLRLGDFVRLNAVAGSRLKVSFAGRVGIVAPSSVLPASEAYAWLVSKRAERPGDIRVLYGLGQWYRRSDQCIPAVEHYRAALAIEPQNSVLLDALGYALSEAGEHAAAIEQYSAALEHDPAYVTAWQNRAYAHLCRNELDKAVQDCEAGLVMDGENPVLWNILGLVRYGEGDFKEALVCYSKAAKYAEVPSSHVHFNHARTLAAMHDYGAACELAATAVALDDEYLDSTGVWLPWAEATLRDSGDSGAANLLMGVHAARQRRWEEAVQHLQRAIEQGVETHVPYVHLAHQDMAHQRGDMAAKWIAIAEKKGPHSPSVHAARGESARLQGDLHRALAAYGKAIQLQPWNASWYQARADVWAGRNDLNAARRDLVMAAEIAPHRADLRRQLGEMARRLDDAKEAVEQFWTAVDIDPHDAGLQLDLARAWWAFLAAGRTLPDEAAVRDETPEEAARKAIIRELDAIGTEDFYRRRLESRSDTIGKALALIRRFGTVPAEMWTLPADEVLTWYRRQAAAAIRASPYDGRLELELQMAIFSLQQTIELERSFAELVQRTLRERLPAQTLSVAEQHGLIAQFGRFPIDARRANRDVATAQFREAERLYARMLDIEPEQSGLWVTRGRLRTVTDQPLFAAEDFERALALDANSAYARKHFAIALVAQGRLGDAMDQLQMCRELEPDRTTPVHWQTLTRARQQVVMLLQQALHWNLRVTTSLEAFKMDRSHHFGGWGEGGQRELQQLAGRRTFVMETMEKCWQTATGHLIDDHDLLLLILENWDKLRTAGSK